MDFNNLAYEFHTSPNLKSQRVSRMQAALSKRSLTQWARRLVRSREPLVQASRVELMLAGLARKPRNAVVGGVDDAITDWTLLDPFKLLVEVAFPSAYCLCYCTILHIIIKQN